MSWRSLFNGTKELYYKLAKNNLKNLDLTQGKLIQFVFYMIIQQLLFVCVLLFATYLFVRRIRQIKKNINLGRSVTIDDNKGQRWRNMLLVALGQKKMFKRPIPALLHLAVYVGFILINIEVLELILDGILGTHRLFLPLLKGIYPFIISSVEVLAFLVLFACVIFLIRRNVFKVNRFTQVEMKGWPALDGNLILIFEIILMCSIFTMNAADTQLQSIDPVHFKATGHFLLSGLLEPLFSNLGETTLRIVERISWWIHMVGILAFLVYVTYSKHLHIFFAFPNTYYANLQPAGEVTNMPSITNEVKAMLDPSFAVDSSVEAPARFGAKDVTDLSWKNILDAYTCTECGRCTSMCPANITGKKLSPRKVMMDVRDRAEELGHFRLTGGDDGHDDKSLLNDYITKEEVMACTSCNACVEACPVLINPLEIILDIRRYLIMEESNSPAEWNSMFTNMENSGSPWQFSPMDRANWTNE